MAARGGVEGVEGAQGVEDVEGEEGEGEEPLHEAKPARRSSWIGKDPWGRQCVKRSLTAERAAAAGVDVEKHRSASGLCQAVRRAEIAAANPVQAQETKVAEARRKRVRRIEEGKEDRDALRALARSRACEAQEFVPLEATPAGMREAAVDGTPRSAKAAGAELRKLTQSFQERLTDPRFYGMPHEELQAVRVQVEVYDRREGWRPGLRPLKRYGGKPTVVPGPHYHLCQ